MGEGVEHHAYASVIDGIRAVELCNDDDSCYVQWFTEPQEVDAFIAELQKAKAEVWPE
jgi:hypothetical protein